MAIIGCWFRKCNKTRADYSSLPDDIITEHILLKLQCMKSIVTCTSVCKSWHALIKSPRFVKTHLSNSYNSSKECFFCLYVRPQWCYSINYYESERLHKYYDLKFPHEGTIHIFGSCNGLICYAERDNFAVVRNIYMWNPAIRKLRTLPKSDSKPSAYGFWFDTDTDDYKVAKVSYTKVEVYSLSTNTWDTIFSTPYPGIQYARIINTYVVHLSGTLHWLLFKENGWNIMSLNIKFRKLHETLILPGENEGSFLDLDLLTSGTRSHALFVLRYDSLWKCRVLAYDESLRELYRIDLEDSGTKARLIGVRNNGIEFLFQKMRNNDGGILVCDAEDFKFKDFSPSAGTIFKLYPFAETLVLLNDKDSSSTANSSVIRSMVRKARFSISRIFYAAHKAIGNSF